MCRNIKTLFNFEPPATDDEIAAASRQFVRKLTGFSKPSQANDVVFERAVEDVAQVARDLLASLTTTAPPRDREVEKTKARARTARRFGTTSSDVAG
jgi:hypothetical protein